MIVLDMLLAVLAIVGLALTGQWVLKSKLHTAFKALALVVCGVAVVFYSNTLLGGTPVNDLRPVTLLLATWGGIFSATKIITKKSNNKNLGIQYGVPLAITAILVLAWWPTIIRVQAGGPSALVPVVSAPASTTTHTTSSSSTTSTDTVNCSDPGTHAYLKNVAKCP